MSTHDAKLRLAFEARVQRVANDGGCWRWTGYLEKVGYGSLKTGKKKHWAHRLAFELYRGPIPARLTLDHLCRNRWCCNPWHLEPVSRGTNVMRGEGPCARNARVSACPKGHGYTPENTYYTKRGSRGCRECNRQRARRNARARAA